MSRSRAAGPVPCAVPILTYHSLDETGSVVSVAPSVFRRQMELLRSRGIEAVSLGELLDEWDQPSGRAPGRRVALTFDDGFCSVAEHAAPVLTRLGFRATVFAVAARSGGSSDWNGEAAALPRLPLLSHTQLGELARGGMEIGAHGLDHSALDRLAGPELEREIVGSRAALEDALGREVRLFAYPFGKASREARALVRSHYWAACSAELACASPADDRHWLPRVDAYYFRHLSLFRTLGTGPGRIYLALRAAGRRARRAMDRS